MGSTVPSIAGAVGVLYDISSLVLTGGVGVGVGVVPPITWSVFVQYIKKVVEITKRTKKENVFINNCFYSSVDYWSVKFVK
jgi:hypothetical protein